MYLNKNVFCLFLLNILMFNWTFAQYDKKGFIYLIAAISQTPEQCVPAHFPLHSYHSRYTSDCSNTPFRGPCEVTITYSKDEKIIGFNFKGPANLDNYINSEVNTITQMTRTSFESYGEVGSDHMIAFNALWNSGFKEAITELWNEFCEHIIVVHSHTLGCCIAQMTILKLRELFKTEQLVYYGYGCPRCGNMDFAANVDKSCSVAVRSNWVEDYFTTVPATSCDRTKKAQASQGTDCWFHCCQATHTKKTFLGLSTSTDTCAIGESPDCTKGANKNSMKDMWGTLITHYGMKCTGRMFLSY